MWCRSRILCNRDRQETRRPSGCNNVHLVCGIIGTLAVALSPDFTLAVQALAVVAYGAVAFPFALILFVILKKTIGLRVSKEEELKGLDLGEHNMEAYSGFQFFTNV